MSESEPVFSNNVVETNEGLPAHMSELKEKIAKRVEGFQGGNDGYVELDDKDEFKSRDTNPCSEIPLERSLDMYLMKIRTDAQQEFCKEYASLDDKDEFKSNVWSFSNSNMMVLNREVDWDKVKTLEDVIRLLRCSSIYVLPQKVREIEDLLKSV